MQSNVVLVCALPSFNSFMVAQKSSQALSLDLGLFCRPFLLELWFLGGIIAGVEKTLCIIVDTVSF